MSDRNKTEYVSINDKCKTDDKKIRVVDSTKFDKFSTLLRKFVNLKNDYEQLTNEGGLSKELNRKYKKKFTEYDTVIKKAYEDLNIRKNKCTVDNYTIELYMREIKEPLTLETLGNTFTNSTMKIKLLMIRKM